LKRLAESIREIGQKTPGAVRPIQDGQYQFELIDGERRWRACRMIGKGVFRAEVVNVPSTEAQFIHSAVANFCQEPHTLLETARTIEKMCEYFSDGVMSRDIIMQKVAKVLGGKSGSWAWSHLRFLQLAPEVQDFIEKGILPFHIGLALIKYKRETQVKFAKHIIAEDLSFKRAQDYVRSAQSNEELLAPNSRRQSPNRDFRRLQNFLRNLGADAETILGMKFHTFVSMFDSRTVKDVTEAIRLIDKRIKSLRDLRETLEEVREKKKGK